MLALSTQLTETDIDDIITEADQAMRDLIDKHQRPAA
jgi:hypothetical protein